MMKTKNLTMGLILLLFLLAGCSSQPAASSGMNRPVTSVSDTGKNTGTSRELQDVTKLLEGSTGSQGTSTRTLEPSTGSIKETKPSIPDTGFTLVVSGDVLSHDSSWRSARQKDGSFDYMPQFQGMQGLLSQGDLTLVNLETPISGEEFGYRGFPKFNAPENLAETLKQVGVDVVVTANNHILDNGVKGLKSNLDNLDRIGLHHFGAARTEAEADTPFLLEINGIQTGFAATTYKGRMEPPEDFAVPFNREAVMRRKIHDLREAGAELIVFHIHWGKEYTEYPTKVQMGLYRILEEEGVDIIIGSHPHRLQPVELKTIEYEGEKKDQAVIWSTANLSWAEPIKKSYVKTGAVFRIDVKREDGVIRIDSINHDLIYNLIEKVVDGIRHVRIIAEQDMEKYKDDYPSQYAIMREEFQWARQVLNTPVDLSPLD